MFWRVLGGVLLFASEALPDGYDHWAVCCVVCAVRGVLCVVCCVLCAPAPMPGRTQRQGIPFNVRRAYARLKKTLLSGDSGSFPLIH